MRFILDIASLTRYFFTFLYFSFVKIKELKETSFKRREIREEIKMSCRERCLRKKKDFPEENPNSLWEKITRNFSMLGQEIFVCIKFNQDAGLEVIVWSVGHLPCT